MTNKTKSKALTRPAADAQSLVEKFENEWGKR